MIIIPNLDVRVLYHINSVFTQLVSEKLGLFYH